MTNPPDTNPKNILSVYIHHSYTTSVHAFHSNTDDHCEIGFFFFLRLHLTFFGKLECTHQSQEFPVIPLHSLANWVLGSQSFAVMWPYYRFISAPAFPNSNSMIKNLEGGGGGSLMNKCIVVCFWPAKRLYLFSQMWTVP